MVEPRHSARWWHYKGAWLAVLILSLMTSRSAPAEDRAAPCDTSWAILSTLSNELREFPVERGEAKGPSQYMLLKSRGGHSWTIVQVFPDDRVCIVARGTEWKAIRWRSPAKEDPS